MSKYNNIHYEYDGLKFDSKNEVAVYKHLKNEGFEVLREPVKYVLWEGCKPAVPFYNINKRTKMLELDMDKLRNITYLPDFQISYAGYTIIIEVKGKENDVFPVKKKLFRKLLESREKVMYFELNTIRQLKQAIEIIKKLKDV